MQDSAFLLFSKYRSYFSLQDDIFINYIAETFMTNFIGCLNRGGQNPKVIFLFQLEFLQTALLHSPAQLSSPIKCPLDMKNEAIW